jgi:hypothetical protein
VDDYRDSGWVFCTPAIYVGYERRFQPERMGLTIKNPPEHNLPNTGEFRDGLGNLQYVYAVGNPADQPQRPSRYQFGQDKASGFGIVRFNKDRTIKVEAYRFLPDVNSPLQGPSFFPGWPVSIDQLDNYRREAIEFLPEIQVKNLDNPVIQLEDAETGELIYSLRILGNNFTPKVFSRSSVTLKVGDPDTDQWKTLNGLNPSTPGPIRVVF